MEKEKKIIGDVENFCRKKSMQITFIPNDSYVNDIHFQKAQNRICYSMQVKWAFFFAFCFFHSLASFVHVFCFILNIKYIPFDAHYTHTLSLSMEYAVSFMKKCTPTQLLI